MENENLLTNSNEFNKKKSKTEKHKIILKYYYSIILYWKILHIILFFINLFLIVHLCFIGKKDFDVKCHFYVLFCAIVIICNLTSNCYCLIKLFQNKPKEATNQISNFSLLISFSLIFFALVLNKKLLGKGVYNFLNHKTNYEAVFGGLLIIVFAVLILTFKMKEFFNDNIPFGENDEEGEDNDGNDTNDDNNENQNNKNENNINDNDEKNENIKS